MNKKLLIKSYDKKSNIQNGLFYLHASSLVTISLLKDFTIYYYYINFW